MRNDALSRQGIACAAVCGSKEGEAAYVALVELQGRPDSHRTCRPRRPRRPRGSATGKWAIVRADGGIVAQSGGITLAAKPGSGKYILNFGSTVAGKPILASGPTQTTAQTNAARRLPAPVVAAPTVLPAAPRTTATASSSRLEATQGTRPTTPSTWPSSASSRFIPPVAAP
jgi:hypothetical protein